MLWPGDVARGEEVRSQPGFFTDLNLDQIFEAILEGREEYDLAPFYYEPLHDVSVVRYRQAVMRDLERPELLAAVQRFAEMMRQVRTRFGYVRKLRDVYQKQRWLLGAMETYCEAVSQFDEELTTSHMSSDGLQGIRDYLFEYRRSEFFKSLQRDTRQMVDELADLKYTVQIRGLRVSVDAYQGEVDLSTQVEQTFAKFRQGDVKDYRAKFADYLDINQVEERILAIVARLFPEQFAHLSDYCSRYDGATDPTLTRFDREIQFYLAYTDYTQSLRAAGLEFCYPNVSTDSKETVATSSFDLALAAKLVSAGQTVICNDASLSGEERVLVITGPNQGGKTTFARMFGQLHHLAALGLTVPGAEATLFLPDQVFTHFEREEDLTTLRSKFEDELYRMHEILEHATSGSLLIMNESFTSTALQDAILVGTWVLQEVIDRQMLCLCVTFVDELASLSENVVSMMSTVNVDDPTIRTFKVVRKPADGLAYAVALADKYGLGEGRLKERIAA